MIFLTFFILLIFGTNADNLRFLQPPEQNSNQKPNSNSNSNTYDYSNYKSVSTNQNSDSQTLTSTNSDESVVYITSSSYTISNSNLNKESGDSSNTENSEFYGVNAAVLVQGGELAITGGTITTKAKGANALCATNNGKVTIEGTTISSTGSSSARGLHATYGGSITATNVKITSTGGSCATLATDRGEGEVKCTKCNLSTAGAGSPLIYSTGDIIVSETTGTSSGAQMVVVEGKNTATVKDSSTLYCTGVGNRNNVDKCGIMLYQSMSGDADSGTSTFNCESSNMEILSTSSVYSSAPMFFITNTDASINLNGCRFNYGSGIFLSAGGTSEWGTSGTNGGVVTLTLNNQEIVGNFVVDENSGLTIVMKGKSSIKGTINADQKAAKLSITLESSSTIELTGNSYYTSIINEDEKGSNLINTTFAWSKTEEKTISRPTGSSKDQPPSSSSKDDDSNKKTSSSNSIRVSLLLIIFILL